MRKNILLLLSMLLVVGYSTQAQEYSMLIKDGHVVDPKNNINKVMDIAIKDGKIALVAENIDPENAQQVVNAEGLYVTPGLIDLHGHVFAGTKPDHYLSDGLLAVSPDGFTFRNGVTTIADTGGAGWKTFPTFKKNIIDHSKTRVLSFLNIVGEGMRGGAYEQDVNDMDPKLSASVARRHSEYVVGFKVAHFNGRDWTAVDKAVEAGVLADMPVMVDFGRSNPPLSIEELFMEHLRPGDIYTHTFTELEGREPIVDVNTRELKPFVKKAQERGIIFDVGFGGASFDFRQAIPAAKENFYPDAISTDLHKGSMNAAMKGQLNVMSIFLALGMDLSDVVKASTSTPAEVINREELGHLSEGAVADVAILNLRKGDFGFSDRNGYKVESDQRLEAEMTIKDGDIVYDLNGLADPVAE